MTEDTVSDPAAQEPFIAVPLRLQQAFGLPETLTGDAFAERMEAIAERKYGEIPLLREMTTPNATAYREAVLHFGAESEEARDQLALLQKQVEKAIEAAQNDPKTLKMLAENERFQGFSLETADAENVTALIAAEMENQADIRRGQLLAEARAQRGQESAPGAWQVENVTHNDVAPPPQPWYGRTKERSASPSVA